MTEEEMKELEILKLKGLKIFNLTPMMGDIIRLQFLLGQKKEHDYMVKMLEEEKKKSFEAGKEEGMKIGYKRGFEDCQTSFRGESDRYRSGLQRDLESGKSEELSRILIRAFEHPNCSKLSRITTISLLINQFPESAVRAIEMILCQLDGEAKKQLSELIGSHNRDVTMFDSLKESWKQEGFKEAETHFKDLIKTKEVTFGSMQDDLQECIDKCDNYDLVKLINRLNDIFMSQADRHDQIRVFKNVMGALDV